MPRFAVCFSVVVIAAAIAGPARAASSVTINGQTYTCTNSCNVTFSGGSYSVSDCCGGQVSTSYPPLTPEQPPIEP